MMMLMMMLVLGILFRMEVIGRWFRLQGGQQLGLTLGAHRNLAHFRRRTVTVEAQFSEGLCFFLLVLQVHVSSLSLFV